MTDEILQNNLFFLSSALSRQLTKQADEAFTTAGLSSSHALLLLMIEKKPEIQPSQLAEILHLKPSTITRLVQKLERRNLVERKSMGRATAIVCTSDGSKMAEEIEDKWQQLIQRKKDDLGERYVEVLSEMIANAMDKL